MRKKRAQRRMCFFSDKLKKQLSQIPNYPLTIVEAPSGFGKTTVIKEYLKENLTRGACEYWYTCLGEPASLAWKGICELLSNVNGKVADDLKSMKMPTMDTLFYMTAHLRDFHCQKETYLVVDNYQLVDCDVPRELLNVFSMHGSPNLHMIFITQQLGMRQQLSIHNTNIHTIDASTFFFDREGTASLFRMEGIRLSEEELENICKSTEGWVSAIRLQILNFKETGSFDFTADIEQLVEGAIWSRLTPAEKDFLLSVSVMDSFTAHQAAMMLSRETLPENIEELLKANDFIRYLPDKHLYSMHSILQDYLQNRFYYHQPEEYQHRIFRKAGQASAAAAQYYPAAEFFYKIKDFDAILSLPFSGEYFDHNKETHSPELLAAIIFECPEEILCKYPFAMLVFGHQAFACGQREAYGKVCRLLSKAAQEKEGKPEEIRRIRGEYALLASLEDFNDLSRMKERQKEAWEILKKPSEIVGPAALWAYADTSVLNVFWRGSGELETELKEMEDSSPLYRKLTRGQGAGAESVMRAEAMLLRGSDDEAEILSHKALYDARSYQQGGICLCAELILARIAILRGDAEGYFTAVKNIQSHAKENTSLYLLRLADLCLSVVSLILGVKENIAPWLYDLESIKKALYAPAVPNARTLYLKLLLLEKRYSEFYGISRLILDAPESPEENPRYGMPAVEHLILLAGLTYKNGRENEAQKHLSRALAIALPDKVYLPFAEQIKEISPLLESAQGRTLDRERLSALIALGKRQAKGEGAIRKAILSERSPLTPREREVAHLAKDRLSAKEIAEKLYISETTVRTILKSVYSKLEIHSRSELNFKEF